jgi:phytol kinase
MTFSPDLWDFFIVFPSSLIYVFSIGYFSYLCKLRFKLKTNYSRKIFHFIIFSTVYALAILFPLHRVAAFGAGAGIVVLLLIICTKKKYLNNVYSALAREQDEPHRSYYLIIPFIATAVGGLTNGILFPTYYQVGYLVAGWGDAAGEPIGVRFGKHKYKVPTLSKTKCTRSVEGSLGVLISSYFASSIVFFSLGYGANGLLLSLGAAFLATLVEAISPHGLDNFTTQFFACLGVYILTVLS